MYFLPFLMICMIVWSIYPVFSSVLCWFITTADWLILSLCLIAFMNNFSEKFELGGSYWQVLLAGLVAI